jgi:hypothetical protein
VSQKLLIILLVVLALIFLITLGMGGCHGGGGTTPSSAGAVKALKGLQGNRFLEIGDKAFVNPQSCFTSAQVLTVNTTCFVTFQKRAFFRKSTRVVFQATRPLKVTIDPGGEGPRLDDKSVAAGDCFAWSINHSGGTMTLTLNSPTGPATVFLLRRPCPER